MEAIAPLTLEDTAFLYALAGLLSGQCAAWLIGISCIMAFRR